MAFTAEQASATYQKIISGLPECTLKAQLLAQGKAAFVDSTTKKAAVSEFIIQAAVDGILRGDFYDNQIELLGLNNSAENKRQLWAEGQYYRAIQQDPNLRGTLNQDFITYLINHPEITTTAQVNSQLKAMPSSRSWAEEQYNRVMKDLIPRDPSPLRDQLSKHQNTFINFLLAEKINSEEGVNELVGLIRNGTIDFDVNYYKQNGLAGTDAELQKVWIEGQYYRVIQDEKLIPPAGPLHNQLSGSKKDFIEAIATNPDSFDEAQQITDSIEAIKDNTLDLDLAMRTVGLHNDRAGNNKRNIWAENIYHSIVNSLPIGDPLRNQLSRPEGKKAFIDAQKDKDMDEQRLYTLIDELYSPSTTFADPNTLNGHMTALGLENNDENKRALWAGQQFSRIRQNLHNRPELLKLLTKEKFVDALIQNRNITNAEGVDQLINSLIRQNNFEILEEDLAALGINENLHRAWAENQYFLIMEEKGPEKLIPDDSELRTELSNCKDEFISALVAQNIKQATDINNLIGAVLSAPARTYTDLLLPMSNLGLTHQNLHDRLQAASKLWAENQYNRITTEEKLIPDGPLLQQLKREGGKKAFVVALSSMSAEVIEAKDVTKLVEDVKKTDDIAQLPEQMKKLGLEDKKPESIRSLWAENQHNRLMGKREDGGFPESELRTQLGKYRKEFIDALIKNNAITTTEGVETLLDNFLTNSVNDLAAFNANLTTIGFSTINPTDKKRLWAENRHHHMIFANEILVPDGALRDQLLSPNGRKGFIDALTGNASIAQTPHIATLIDNVKRANTDDINNLDAPMAALGLEVGAGDINKRKLWAENQYNRIMTAGVLPEGIVLKQLAERKNEFINALATNNAITNNAGLENLITTLNLPAARPDDLAAPMAALGLDHTDDDKKFELWAENQYNRLMADKTLIADPSALREQLGRNGGKDAFIEALMRYRMLIDNAHNLNAIIQTIKTADLNDFDMPMKQLGLEVNRENKRALWADNQYDRIMSTPHLVPKDGPLHDQLKARKAECIKAIIARGGTTNDEVDALVNAVRDAPITKFDNSLDEPMKNLGLEVNANNKLKLWAENQYYRIMRELIEAGPLYDQLNTRKAECIEALVKNRNHNNITVDALVHAVQNETLDNLDKPMRALGLVANADTKRAVWAQNQYRRIMEDHNIVPETGPLHDQLRAHKTECIAAFIDRGGNSNETINALVDAVKKSNNIADLDNYMPGLGLDPLDGAAKQQLLGEARFEALLDGFSKQLKIMPHLKQKLIEIKQPLIQHWSTTPPSADAILQLRDALAQLSPTANSNAVWQAFENALGVPNLAAHPDMQFAVQDEDVNLLRAESRDNKVITTPASDVVRQTLFREQYRNITDFYNLIANAKFDDPNQINALEGALKVYISQLTKGPHMLHSNHVLQGPLSELSKVLKDPLHTDDELKNALNPVTACLVELQNSAKGISSKPSRLESYAQMAEKYRSERVRREKSISQDDMDELDRIAQSCSKMKDALDLAEGQLLIKERTAQADIEQISAARKTLTKTINKIEAHIAQGPVKEVYVYGEPCGILRNPSEKEIENKMNELLGVTHAPIAVSMTAVAASTGKLESTARYDTHNDVRFTKNTVHIPIPNDPAQKQPVDIVTMSQVSGKNHRSVTRCKGSLAGISDDDAMRTAANIVENFCAGLPEKTTFPLGGSNAKLVEATYFYCEHVKGFTPKLMDGVKKPVISDEQKAKYIAALERGPFAGKLAKITMPAKEVEKLQVETGTTHTQIPRRTRS